MFSRFAGFSALVSVLSTTLPAEAAQWFLELHEQSVDEPVLRRTLALELREVEIPGHPERSDDEADDVSLFVRVKRDDGKLYASLWDRGEYIGRRQISDSGHPKVKARRVGLVVAELARELRLKRARAERRLQREREVEAERALKAANAQKKKRLSLRSGVEMSLLPQGAWLIGPTVGTDFNSNYPLRFHTQAGWSTGSLTALSTATLGNTAPAWSTFEIGGGTSYVFDVDPKTEFTIGALVSASAVHTSGATEVDGIAGQHDTWSSRGTLRLGGGHRFSDLLLMYADLNVGAVLRPIPLRRAEVEERLGGVFFGLAVGGTLSP